VRIVTIFSVLMNATDDWLTPFEDAPIVFMVQDVASVLTMRILFGVLLLMWLCVVSLAQLWILKQLRALKRSTRSVASDDEEDAVARNVRVDGSDDEIQNV
jgi:hypothetical protein